MKRMVAGICVLGMLSGSAGAVVSEMTPPPPEEDVVVITPTFDYDTIAEQLEKVVSCKIISISDVIMG